MEVNRAAVSNPQASEILAPNGIIDSRFEIIDDYKEAKPSSDQQQKAERTHVRMTARNLSELAVNRINVYASGRKDPILGTNFDGGYDKDHYASQFFSSVAFPAPYSIKAIVDRNGDCYSGELEINRSGHLDIDIHEKVIAMNLYSDKAKTELIATKVLTPTPFRPEQGNHPLV